MGIIKNWKGSWGTPDLGVSEWLGSKIGTGTTQQSGSNLLPQSVQKYVAPVVQNKTGINIGVGGTNYTPPAYTPPPVDKQTPPPPAGNPPPSVSNPISNTYATNANDAINTINSNTNQYGDFIEQDYNNAINYLNSQEQGLRGDSDIAQSEIGTGYNSAINSLGNAQTQGQADIAGQVQTGEKSASSAMQQARDVFRQTQQQNIMQLSGAGLSSSSVNEALAERLGIETARRMFSVTGNLDEIRQNASKELTRINEYYSNKKQELESTKNIEVSKIQQALIKGLDQINYSRNQATSDKAKSRYDLLSNAQSQIASIKQQQLQFENSLKEWATKNSNALKPLATDPSFLQSIASTQNNFNTQFNPSGFSYNPSFSTDAYGRVSSPVKWSSAKKDPNDPNASLDNILSELNQ